MTGGSKAGRADESTFPAARLFELAPDLMAVVGHNGYVLAVNPAWERLLGWSSEDLLSRPWIEFVHPDEREAALERYREHLDSDRESFTTEVSLVAKDGHRHRFLLTTMSVPDEERIYAIGRDVTEERERLERLVRSEALLAEAEEVAHVGSWELDFVTGERHWSEELRRIIGVGPDSPASFETFLDVVHPDERPWMTELFERMVARGERFEAEYRIVRPGSGEERLLRDRVEIVRSERGDPVRAVGTVRDVTDLTRMEAERERAGERLAKLAEATIAINAASTLDAALDATTAAAREIIGAHQAVTSLTAQGSWAQAISAVSLSEKYARWQGYDVTPDGSGIYRLVCERNEPMRLTQAELEAHPDWRGFGEEGDDHPPMRGWLAAPLIGRTGENLGLIQLSDRHEGEFTAEDQTVLVQLAQAASVAVERAQFEERYLHSQKMEAIGQFAGGIAHDFNNVLMAIQGYAELVLQRVEAEDVRRDVEEVKHAAARATELTRQLLAFGRKQVLRPQVLELNDVVRGIESMLRRLIGSDVELAVDLDPDLGLVTADQGQLEQVLANLAANARDSMPRGGRLTIETRNVRLEGGWSHPEGILRGGDYVALAVSDTGLGMDRETRQRAFEPFFTTKAAGKGTGLGLSTVHGIIRQSGGDVALYSEPGQGTTVRIYLPRVLAQVPEKPSAAVPEAPGGTERILLVEDNDSVRLLLEKMLRDLGYSVSSAGSGPEVFTLLEEGALELDLLVTDIVMPGMSGRELAERLTRMRSGVRVLFISGHTEDVAVRTGSGSAAGVAFLAKPFTVQELAAKIRAVLDSRVRR